MEVFEIIDWKDWSLYQLLLFSEVSLNFRIPALLSLKFSFNCSSIIHKLPNWIKLLYTKKHRFKHILEEYFSFHSSLCQSLDLWTRLSLWDFSWYHYFHGRAFRSQNLDLLHIQKANPPFLQLIIKHLTDFETPHYKMALQRFCYSLAIPEES